MVNKKIYILGAGNMAREALSIYKDLNKLDNVGGFIEENCKRKSEKINNKRIMNAPIIKSLTKNPLFIGAIGSPMRKKWIEKLELKGFDFDILIHPSVIMGDSVKIAKGCIICPGVILTQGINVGYHSIININSTVNHDCVIGNFVTIGPGVNIAGNVKIGDKCWIGIGATIIQNVSIGQGAFIGAGAVVVNDIPKNTLAVGLPAKPIKVLNKQEWERLMKKS